MGLFGNAGLMGNLLGAGMQGYDYQDALQRKRQNDDDERQRKQAADSRAATLFGEQQEAYQHNLGRRDDVEGDEDALRKSNVKGAGLKALMEQHAVDRLPTTDAQTDSAFDLHQQMEKHTMANQDATLALHRASVGSELSLRDLQKRQAEMGLDDATLAHSTMMGQRAFAQGYQAWQQTGDPTAMIHAYQSFAGPGAGHAFDGVKLEPDGSVTATQDGKVTHKWSSPKEMFSQGLSTISPETTIQTMYANMQNAAAAQKAKAEHPNQFSDLISDNAGYLHRYDKTTNKTEPVLDQSGKPMRGHLAGRNEYSDPLSGDPNAAAGGPMASIAGGNAAAPAPAPTGAGVGMRAAAGVQQAAPVAPKPPPGARQAPDGNFYLPDPARPGKFLQWNAPGASAGAAQPQVQW